MLWNTLLTLLDFLIVDLSSKFFIKINEIKNVKLFMTNNNFELINNNKIEATTGAKTVIILLVIFEMKTALVYVLSSKISDN